MSQAEKPYFAAFRGYISGMSELPPTRLYEVCPECGALVETSVEDACPECGAATAKPEEPQRPVSRAGLFGGLFARVAERLPDLPD